jgi:FKBP-type peptidyl-prolyl cis-trans isomerase FkpA
MKITKLSGFVALVALGGFACKGTPAPTPSPSPAALQTDEHKTLYAMGLMLGRNLQPLNLTPAELEIVERGIRDQAKGAKPEVELQQYAARVNELAKTRMAAGMEKQRQDSMAGAGAQKDKGKAFAEQAAQEAGAQRSNTGLVYRTLTAGKGANPKASDTVKVHYQGTLVDGTEFDSSVKRGEPVEFPLNAVIPCWTEGVQKMKVGEKAKLVCPSDIAYGDAGRPPTIPGGATLVFEVELLGIGGGK